MSSVASSDCEEEWDNMEAAARQSLKKEILAVIKPYTHSRKKPPFSACELTVMAVMCADTYSLEKTEILFWICDNFPYYSRKALWEYVKTQKSKEYEPDEFGPKEVVDDFHESLDDWKTPLKDADRSGLPVLANYCGEPPSITVPIGPGRVFLRHWLEPKRKGVFPFLKLPPELRNTIYEMVFSYPGLEIAPSMERGVVLFDVLGREVDDVLMPRTWSEWLKTYGRDNLNLPPPREIFALLSVNKQIYEEAMCTFYSVNRFYFDLTYALAGASPLTHMPSSRMEHLSNVYMNLSVRDAYSRLQPFPRSMKSLMKISSIERLQIEIEKESVWLNLKPQLRKDLGRTTKITKFEQIPGFRDLAVVASKAENLVFHGDCKGIEKYIREEVAKVKSDGNAAAKPKKQIRAKRDPVESREVEEEFVEGGARPTKKRLIASK